MNPFLSLLTYRAFRDDPLDVEEPITSRFKKRMFADNRLLAVSVGRSQWRTCLVTFDQAGVPAFGEIELSPPATPAGKDGMLMFLNSQRAKHKVRYAAVGISHGFAVEYSGIVPRLPDTETMHMLQNDPIKLMGDGFSTEDMGAVVHHPTMDTTTLKFKAKATDLKGIRELLGSAQLQIVRIVCEQAQMLELAYSLFPGSAPDLHGYQMLLLASPSSSLILPLWHNWTDVHFDPQLDENAVVSLMNSFQEICAGTPNVKLGYLDGGLPGMADLIPSITHLNPTPLLKDDGAKASFRAIVLN